MIYKDKTNNHIEEHKKALGLTGDVYVVNNIHIASLASHKAQFPDSTATTIEEAEAEYVAYMKESKLAQIEAEKARREQAVANFFARFKKKAEGSEDDKD